MADELNIPTHRWYQTRYHVPLAKADLSRDWIFNSGIQRIDDKIIREPLFGASEPGAWYDPSDLTTMFTDTAGTTPVTTAGQSVALALDKSKGLVLGPELVTNGDFSNGSTGWTLGSGWSISGGVATAAATAGSSLAVSGTPGIISGRTYRATLTVVTSTVSGSGVGFNIGGTVVGNFTTPGTYTVLIAAGATGVISVNARGAGTWEGTIDNISVKELPGNHATQSTAASRPLYGVVPATGRRNLLTFTEQFDNAAWAKAQATVTANSSVAPDGTTTADTLLDTAVSNIHYMGQSISSLSPSGKTYTVSAYLKASTLGFATLGISDISSGSLYAVAVFNLSNGTLSTSGAAGTGYSVSSTSITATGNGWYRCTVTAVAGTSVSFLNTVVGTNKTGVITAAAGGFESYLGNGSGILVWGAQIEQASTATAYQRVVSALDVTEAGVQSLSYLSFDGVDDFLVTPTITPATDKAQVFAGVRKISGVGFQTVLEYGTGIAENGLAIFAPSNVGPDYDFRLASNARATAASYSPPITNVLAVSHDLAGATAATETFPRINGAAVSFTGSSVASGNFINAPLYIGRRAGTSLPFNGNLFSLIVRFGANLTTQQIADTEAWVNTKTRAY